MGWDGMMGWDGTMGWEGVGGCYGTWDVIIDGTKNGWCDGMGMGWGWDGMRMGWDGMGWDGIVLKEYGMVLRDTGGCYGIRYSAMGSWDMG